MSIGNQIYESYLEAVYLGELTRCLLGPVDVTSQMDDARTGPFCTRVIIWDPVSEHYFHFQANTQSGKKMTTRTLLTPISRHFLQSLLPSIHGVRGTPSLKAYNSNKTQTLRYLFHAFLSSHVLSTSLAPRHPEEGTENNSHLGRQCFGMHST
ncbi:hypothetical protein T265_06826 [Opisthorchis viverrini]|uniref:Uncharacterized protein n=1 Tax=Opisthorchis viverrini TaxID=6198 RepID=A0A074ZR31_OPIVI|nr:hypothetical protein T265_06826 [Opisthorchis viverrini]KER25795.1 hypothetical protein T265_06826 [Opisthorchis viverrini]